MMTLMEFSIYPLDKGASVSAYVARALTIVEKSGMEYRLTPMGTVVEGEWGDLLNLLTECLRELEKDSERITLQAKFDHRKGVTGAINSKIKSLQDKAGIKFRT
ncbi:MAG: MTH1187 family thiamine-binding protein [Deltaproteobacteria bacterium]|nr:MTH1187 family thiamine-binding protein [Deltaproteobacteria bacterium]